MPRIGLTDHSPNPKIAVIILSMRSCMSQICWWISECSSVSISAARRSSSSAAFRLRDPSTLAAALLAYDATVTTNERSDLTIGALLGDGTDGTADNKLRPGERIIHVDMGSPLIGERAGYHRVISRAYAEWPLVETVVRVVLLGERFGFVRVTAGGIAPVPLRFIDVEDALRSAVSDEASIRKAAALAAKNAKPLSGTAYKLKLLEQEIVDLVQSLTQ